MLQNSHSTSIIHACLLTIFFLLFQRLSNGSIDPDSDVNRVIELQETIEKQNSELTNSRAKLQDLNNKINELEEKLSLAQKDLIKTQESNVKFQRDLREVSAAFWWIFSSRKIRQHWVHVEFNDCGLCVYMIGSDDRCWFFILFITSWGLSTHKQLETDGCVLSTVATDALVLKHQAISSYRADYIFIVSAHFQAKLSHLWWTILENYNKQIPRCLRVKWTWIERLSLSKPCHHINTLRPRQNSRHLPDNTLKRIFLNENVRN